MSRARYEIELFLFNLCVRTPGSKRGSTDVLLVPPCRHRPGLCLLVPSQASLHNAVHGLFSEPARDRKN